MDNKLELTREMRELICQGDTIEAEGFLPNFSKTLLIETSYPLVPGAIYSSVSPGGSSYSIEILEVTDTEVRLRNTRDGCGGMTLSLRAAYDILEGCTVQMPLKFVENTYGTIPT